LTVWVHSLCPMVATVMFSFLQNTSLDGLRRSLFQIQTLQPSLASSLTISSLHMALLGLCYRIAELTFCHHSLRPDSTGDISWRNAKMFARNNCTHAS
jgi:hypothetical protein